MEPHDVTRKLAAILSADVVGYSRLMQADERAALEMLKSCRAAIQRAVEQHSGRIVNAPGDAVLAEFPSAVEAVRCAAEIQYDLKNTNSALPAEQRMDYRIGVNLGEVIEETDGTLYGDGVNIAARLEGLAEAGGVCLSGKVFDEVERRLDLPFDYVGEHAVKNIAKPIRVYRLRGESAPAPHQATRSLRPRLRFTLLGLVVLVLLAVAGTLTWQGRQSRAPANDPVLALPKGPSIAVLPFTNLSGDPKEGYIADAIAEEIITQLTQFSELFVLARNTTFQYKGQAVDIKKLGRELGVRYVLEGSVQKAPDGIRVTAQLIDASSGAHLWAETYDRKLLTAGDIFGVQDEITGQVVAKIADVYGVISRAGLKEAQSKGAQSLAAYECVLLAREYYFGSSSPELHLRARDCLERAVTVEPDYVDAWAWVGLLYLDEYRYGYNPRPTPPALDRALKAARRAVSLDPANAMAHNALAQAYHHRSELGPFIIEAEQALKLNPNNTQILAEMGLFFVNTGQSELMDRSLALTKKAMALNPHHPVWYWDNPSNYHYYRREYEQALVAAQKFNDPEFYWSQAHMARVYGQLGRKKEAQAAVAQLLKLYPDFPKKARKEVRMWMRNEAYVEHDLDGLRKAGLEIPPE